MKTLFYLLFFSFFCIALHSQDTFLRQFGNSCCSKEFISTMDSGFVSILGNQLIKLDKNSEIQWAKEYDAQGNNIEYVTDLNTSRDGGFLILARSESRNFTSYALAIKVDSLGNHQWTAEVAGLGEGESPKSIIETSSRDIFVTSTTSVGSNEIPPIVASITKLAPDGSFIWTNNYFLPVDLNPENLIELSPNRFLISGIISNPNGFEKDVHTFMMDSNGLVLWSKVYSGFKQHRIKRTLKVSENKIMIIGTKGDFFDDDHDIFNLAIDTLGNPLSFHVYENDHISKEIIEDVHQAGRDDIFLMGSLIDTTNREFSILLKINHEGELIWTRSYLGEESEVYAMTSATDGGLMLRGLMSYRSGTIGFLAKIKVNGESACMQDSLLQFQQSSLKVMVRKTSLESISSNIYRTINIPSSRVNPFYVAQCADSCIVGANFERPATEACVGSTLVFQNRSTNAFHYDWYLNGMWMDSLTDLRHTFSRPGIYEVKLVSRDSLCSDSMSYHLAIKSSQDLSSDFRINSRLMDVNFESLSPEARTWEWDFGDGSSSDFINPRHVYDELGTFQICLTTTNVCGSKVLCKNLQIRDTIKAEFQISYAPRGIWDNSSFEISKQIIQAKDGTFIVFGDKGFLVKINQSGKVEWDRGTTLKGGYADGHSGISETEDGGFIVGAARDANTNDEHITLCKTDKNGLVEWISEFQERRVKSYITHIIQTQDKGYVFVGKYGTKGVIGKVGFYGQKLWLHGISGAAECISLEELPSGEFIVMGRATGASGIYWGRFSSDGQRISSKGIIPDQGNVQPLHMSRTYDGHYLITGALRNATLGAFLLKIDLNGNINWSQAYGSSFKERGTSAHEFPNGEIYMSGGTQTSRSVILKLDSLGNIIWNKRYGFILRAISPADKDQGGIPTFDGGYIKTDSRDVGSLGGNEHFSLAKINTDGEAGGCLVDSAGMMAMLHPFNITSTAIDTIFILQNDFKYRGHSIGILGSYNMVDSVFCYNDSVLINCSTPTASFSFSDSANIFQFVNSSSSANSWRWDFGDGDTAVSENPQHVFSNPGNYQVCLTASSPCGEMDTYCENININTSGFKDHLEFPIRIIPNPSGGTVKIQFEGNGRLFNILLVDHLGKKLWTEDIRIESDCMLDFSSFSSGMYYLLIQSSNGQWAREKLLIVH